MQSLNKNQTSYSDTPSKKPSYEHSTNIKTHAYTLFFFLAKKAAVPSNAANWFKTNPTSVCLLIEMKSAALNAAQWVRKPREKPL